MTFYKLHCFQEAKIHLGIFHNLSTLRWCRQLKSSLMEDNALLTLHIQYHGVMAPTHQQPWYWPSSLGICLPEYQKSHLKFYIPEIICPRVEILLAVYGWTSIVCLLPKEPWSAGARKFHYKILHKKTSGTLWPCNMSRKASNFTSQCTLWCM